MQITVESLSKVKKKITVEIPAARVASEIEKVYDEIGKKAAIKGFRKGKVPRALLEKHYSEVMQQDVVKKLVNDTYFKAVDDEKIHPVSYPSIENDDVKKGDPFRYSAVVEIFPDVTVGDYSGLEVNREIPYLDEQVIERRIEEMRESLAQLKPVEDDHAAAAGDFVTFDFEGFTDGAPFEGGKSEDFQLELGSGRFIPGFEDQLVGMKTGEEGKITVTFPENYGKSDLAGKEAVFLIKIKDIKTKEMPPLDDDLAKELGQCETLEQLRSRLREEYEAEEHRRIDSEFKENVVKALISKNDFEIPETLIGQQLDMMLENTKKRLAYQKMSLEMMGLDDEQYKLKFKTVAESQVKGSLLLEALAGQLEIAVTDGDLEDKFSEMSGDNHQSLEAVKKYYLQNAKAKENMKAQIREDKAIDFLISQAKVVDVSRDELKRK